MQHSGPARVVEHRDARDRAVARAQGVDGDVPGQQRQAGAARGRDECPLDLGTGGVAPGPDHAERRVPALAGALQRAGRGRVEHGAARPQPGHRGRAVGQDGGDGGGVAQPGTRGEGVGDVGVDAVARHVPDDDGDPALGPPGRAGVRGVLGDDDDPQPGGGGVERGGETGDAAADDDEVRAGLPGARAAHSPPPGRPIAIIRCTAARPRAASSGSTCTSSVPSRRLRSSASGVIIFM